jgi:hypothetical protein
MRSKSAHRRKHGVTGLRAAQNRASRKCRLLGCRRPVAKSRASPYCNPHAQRVRRFGSPTGQHVPRYAYAVQRKIVRAFIRASLRTYRNRDAGRAAAVRAAVQWVVDWLRDRTDIEAQHIAASAARPKIRRPAGRTPQDIVADVVACWLHVRNRLDGAELDSALFIAAAGGIVFWQRGSRYDFKTNRCVVVTKKRSPTARARLRVGGLLRQRLSRVMALCMIASESRQ